MHPISLQGEQKQKQSPCNSLTRAEEGKVRAFLLANSPAEQVRMAKNPLKCYFGNYMTLADIDRELGEGVSSAWLVPQLHNLSEFCGAKNKLQGETLKECAEMIADDYFYLKTSELMLFFQNMKKGRYGKFYGTIDPHIIFTSLNKFIVERSNAHEKRESDIKAKEEEERRKNAISYDEYCRLYKNKKNQNEAV